MSNPDCGWLEYFADGPHAGFFADAIEDIDALIVPSICIYEVFRRVVQQRGENDALLAIAMMHQGNVVGLVVHARRPAWLAIQVAACRQHYHGNCAKPLGYRLDSRLYQEMMISLACTLE